MNLRHHFPILQKTVNGKPLIYLDNAATTQKPQAVLDAIVNFYTTDNANIHRGVYALSEHATALYEQARSKVAAFINADPHEIVFTRGTTESINCIASSWGAEHVAMDDEIIITELEHHSNLLPWQQLCKKNGAKLKYIPVNQDGTLNYAQLPLLITPKTKLVSVSQISNMLGTEIDIAKICAAAQAVGAKVFVDAAQSAPHQKIDVKKMAIDFLAFSGHKMLAPTGIGVLYINKKLHENFPPYQFGGGMVYEAGQHTAVWQKMPHRMEAGTPPIAQAIGLAAAINFYAEYIDFELLKKHEAALCTQLIDGLATFERVNVLGPVEHLKQSGHLVSFTIAGIHPHDAAAFLDKQGMCVRAGHQCAQPLAKKMGLDGSLRASFFAYNTPQEVDNFLAALEKLMKLV